MTFVLCQICGRLCGPDFVEFKERKLCRSCFEVKSLVDGIIIDVQIDKVEELLMYVDLDGMFDRGIKAVN